MQGIETDTALDGGTVGTFHLLPAPEPAGAERAPKTQHRDDIPARFGVMRREGATDGLEGQELMDFAWPARARSASGADAKDASEGEASLKCSGSQNAKTIVIHGRIAVEAGLVSGTLPSIPAAALPSSRPPSCRPRQWKNQGESGQVCPRRFTLRVNPRLLPEVALSLCRAYTPI